MVSREALAGYLLEEVIAALLRTNGYQLLQRQEDDEQALKEAGNGLLVRGRGADHQADALGDLLVPTPFSLPIRLFVEAKNRTEQVDLKDVRNAHGVIHDINERYSAEQSLLSTQPLRCYQYCYALFSASGFKETAQSYALAHHISLIDLSGPAFASMGAATLAAADTAITEATAAGLGAFPVKQARQALRAALAAADETTSDAPGHQHDGNPVAAAATAARDTDGQGIPPHRLASWAGKVTADLKLSTVGESLILGFPPAPFILAMRPDSLDEFESYVNEHSDPFIDVDIKFARGPLGGDWVVTPADGSGGFRLSFGLPGALESWLLSAPEETRQRAAIARRTLLRTISLFLEDRLVRLRFSPSARPPVTVEPTDQGPTEPGLGVDARDMSALRLSLSAPTEPRIEPELRLAEPEAVRPAEGTGWSERAARELMRLLDESYQTQAEIIREAVRLNGTIDRTTVYLIADFPEDRTLRGLTRPPGRITGALIKRGLLPDDTAYALQAVYEQGVRATHFVVPEDLVQILRGLDSP